MSYLLDTNICSAHLRGDGRIFNRFLQHMGRLSVPTIVLAELYSWTCRAKTKAGYAHALRAMLADVKLLSLDHNVARKFGELRAAQLDSGKLTPELDLVIGATALVHDLTLVTDNIQDFATIPGLRIENWLGR